MESGYRSIWTRVRLYVYDESGHVGKSTKHWTTGAKPAGWYIFVGRRNKFQKLTTE